MPALRVRAPGPPTREPQRPRHQERVRVRARHEPTQRMDRRRWPARATRDSPRRLRSRCRHRPRRHRELPPMWWTVASRTDLAATQPCLACALFAVPTFLCGLLLEFDFDERELARARVDDVVLHADRARIGLAGAKRCLDIAL